MSNGRRRGVEHEVEMSMTPMIDVTFQLLIFFIVTLQFRKLERKLDVTLPTDFGRNGPSKLVEETIVNVTLRYGDLGPELEWAGRELPETEFEDRCQVFESWLAEFEARWPETVVRLDVGRGVHHRDVVRVLDILHRVDVDVKLSGIEAAGDPQALDAHLPTSR